MRYTSRVNNILKNYLRLPLKDAFPGWRYTFRIFTSLFVGLLGLFFLACTKTSSVTEGTSLESLSNGALPKGEAYYRIFDVSQNEKYINEAVVKDEKIFLPEDFFSKLGSYNGRDSDSTAFPVDLLMRVYLPSSVHSNGDFFFETPVIGTAYEISSIATGLTWFLRHEVSPKPKFSFKQWKKILNSIKVSCENCRSLAASGVFKELKASSSLQNIIFQNLAEGPYQRISQSRDPLAVAYSVPVIEEGVARPLLANEGSDASLILALVDFEDSSTRKNADMWVETYKSIEKSPIVTTQVSLLLSYDYLSEGDHQYKAKFKPDSNAAALTFEFPVIVKDINISPLWTDTSTLTFQVNHGKTYDLREKATDPDDSDNISNLTFKLITFPAGMSLRSQFDLYWRPLLPQLGNHTATIEANDNYLGAEGKTLESLNIEVIPDHYPTLVSNHSAVVTMTENQETSITIRVFDEDGDAVTLDLSNLIEMEATQEKTLLPDGKTTEIILKLKPTYLKAIDSNASEIISLKFDYDTVANPLLISLGNQRGTLDLSLEYINADDPPNFFEGIPEGDTNENRLAVTEGQAFEFPKADNSSGYVSFGRFADSSLNPTNLTYTIENLGDSNCDWTTDTLNPGFLEYISVAGNFVLRGQPSYSSPAECEFRVVAKDDNNLEAKSQIIYFSVQNQNRTPTYTSQATALSASEGVSLFTDLKGLNFYDEDLDLDPNEQMILSCIDCPAGVAFSGSNLSWTPSFDTVVAEANHIFDLTIRATDHSGAFVEGIVSIDVTNMKSPPIISVLTDINFKEINEGSTGFIDFTVSAGSTDAIDNYDYMISSLLCTSSASCLTGGLYLTDTNNIPVDSETLFSTGSTTTFRIVAAPNFNDGNATFPANSGTKSVEVMLAYDFENTVKYIAKAIQTKIKNVNRVPSKMVLLNASDTIQGTTIDIPYSAVTTYNYVLRFEDDDGNNDAYGFFVNNSAQSGSSNQVGKIIKKPWAFVINTMCIKPDLPYKNVTFQYTFYGTDGRGGQTNSLITTFKINGAKNICP